MLVYLTLLRTSQPERPVKRFSQSLRIYQNQYMNSQQQKNETTKTDFFL